MKLVSLIETVIIEKGLVPPGSATEVLREGSEWSIFDFMAPEAQNFLAPIR